MVVAREERRQERWKLLVLEDPPTDVGVEIRRSVTSRGLESYTTNVVDTQGAPVHAAGESLEAYPAATRRSTSISDYSRWSAGMA